MPSLGEAVGTVSDADVRVIESVFRFLMMAERSLFAAVDLESIDRSSTEIEGSFCVESLVKVTWVASGTFFAGAHCAGAHAISFIAH